MWYRVGRKRPGTVWVTQGCAEGVVLTRILSSLLFELRTDIELARFILWTERETQHGTVNTEPLRRLTHHPVSPGNNG